MQIYEVQNNATNKVSANAGLDKVTSDICKHKQQFGLSVKCSYLVHFLNNIFS
jgi:hypothetical protein